MPGSVKVGGVWKNMASASVKVGGSWKTVSAAWTRVGGAWKQWYSATSPAWINAVTAGIGTYLNTAAADSSGNYYMGEYNGIVAKYSLNGILQWSIRLSTNNISTLVTDTSGNIYAGYYANSTTPGIVKISSSGTILGSWTCNTGTSIDSFPYIAVDSSQNMYMGAGSYISKLNSSGTLQWGRTVSGVVIKALSTDSSGNVYGTGYRSIGLNLGRVVIVKFNSSGTLQWQRELYRPAGDGYDSSHAIVASSTGECYVAHRKDADSRYSLIKLDTSGNILFQRDVYSFNYSHSPPGSNSIALVGGYIYYGIQGPPLPENINSMTWIKYSESTIQLQRALRVPQLPGFSVSGSYVQLAGGGSPVNVYANVPTDGSKTGTITIGSNSFTYTTTTLSETAGSYAITNSSGSYGSNGNGWSSAGVTATSNPAFTYQVGYL